MYNIFYKEHSIKLSDGRVGRVRKKQTKGNREEIRMKKKRFPVPKKKLFLYGLLVFSFMALCLLHLKLTTKLADLFPTLVGVSSFLLASLFFVVVVVISLDIANESERTQTSAKTNDVDPLTGLVNASGVPEMLEAFLRTNQTGPCSMICLDVVSFHRFNTMFGYGTGDNLLRVIGSVLRSHYRCGSRLGNDTFMLIANTSHDMVEQLKERLHNAIGDEFGKQYPQMVSFKFGVCTVQDDGNSLRTVRDRALLALKDAKRLPKRRDIVYGDELFERADLEKNIELNMLHAFSKGEFIPYIQPRFRVESGSWCGGEALVRWQSEQLGFVCPDQFIPLFEKNGFIVEIDFFMLACAFHMIQEQLAGDCAAYPISVNLSKVTLAYPNYLERLRNLIDRYPIPLEYIELEVTESVLEDDPEAVLSLLRTLKELGFSVAMDDFGSGYSSLNTLRELPVDVLKIDRDFLKESETSEKSKKIIRNIVNMSRELSVGAVCEGVETENQLEFLKSIDCDYAQGYYLARPMPLSEYEQLYLSTLTAETTLETARVRT